MGPAPMVTLTTTRWPGRRSGGCAALAAALACAGAFLPAPPACAADPITAADQSYFAYYHLDQARAKGYTGKGVTIAMLDGEVDTGAVELSGASISQTAVYGHLVTTLQRPRNVSCFGSCIKCLRHRTRSDLVDLSNGIDGRR